MSAITTSENDTMTVISDKLTRLKQHVYKLAPHKSADPNMSRLLAMSTTEFLAAAQLLIKARGITTPGQLTAAILDTTGLHDEYMGLPAADKSVLDQYSAYFFEVSLILLGD